MFLHAFPFFSSSCRYRSPFHRSRSLDCPSLHLNCISTLTSYLPFSVAIMRFGTLLSLLTALTLILPSLSFPSPPSRSREAYSSSKLKPISVDNYDMATGVHRRSANDFSNLDLQTHSELLYGRSASQYECSTSSWAGLTVDIAQEQFIFANLTLRAADGLLIVTMERFEPLTSKVDCNDEDGIMSLTFKSRSAFEYALQTWNFINEAEEQQFLLIANHAQCGPDDERQPYMSVYIPSLNCSND